MIKYRFENAIWYMLPMIAHQAVKNELNITEGGEKLKSSFFPS